MKNEYSKEDLIEEVKNQTELGQKIIETHMAYLKWVTSGDGGKT